MTITKPHTLNRPLAELRQLRENPELIEQIPTEELRRLAFYAIVTEEMNRDGLRSGHPCSAGDQVIIKHAAA